VVAFPGQILHHFDFGSSAFIRHMELFQKRRDLLEA